MILTSTDQLVVISSPWILCGFWLLFLVLSWSRINKYRCFILTLNKKVGLRKIVCTYWKWPTHHMVSRKRNSEFSLIPNQSDCYDGKTTWFHGKRITNFSGTFNPISLLKKITENKTHSDLLEINSKLIFHFSLNHVMSISLGISSIKFKTNMRFVIVKWPAYLVSQSLTKIQKLAWRPTFLSGKVIIKHLDSDLCYKFCQRGFRIGVEPETWTLIQFGTNYFLFLMGQAIANVHIGIWIFPKNLSFQNYKKEIFS